MGLRKYLKLNKKTGFFLLCGVILLIGICIINNKNKEIKELPKVMLKEPINNQKQFAIMAEQTKGKGNYEFLRLTVARSKNLSNPVFMLN